MVAKGWEQFLKLEVTISTCGGVCGTPGGGAYGIFVSRKEEESGHSSYQLALYGMHGQG